MHMIYHIREHESSHPVCLTGVHTLFLLPISYLQDPPEVCLLKAVPHLSHARTADAVDLSHHFLSTMSALQPCFFYHGHDVSQAMVMWPPCWRVTHSLTENLMEQTRTNMSQPGQRPGIAVGNGRHVLQALWSRKDI